MSCDKTNIGSKKSIINNGGIFENEYVDADGNLEERYWISLKNLLISQNTIQLFFHYYHI